jgi:tRNA modification GTPase
VTPDPADTIVALATAPGPGARAIVRLSGRRAAAVAAGVFRDFTQADRRIVEGKIVLPDVSAPLPADLYHVPAPRSSTGQDVVELHTLACPPLVELLVAHCLGAGARAARPGEFTMRAFLAGKLDLTRAEAVLAVIEAGSRGELTRALAQLAGGIAQPLHALRDDLLNLLADVEAGLDFADEDVQFVGTEALLGRLAKGLALLTLVRRQLDQRGVADRPFRVVLVGRPNAGKSSLFNALVAAPRAIVSAAPGTTRDYLEQTLDVGGVPVQLVDTAGLHDAAEPIESAAQTLGRREAAEADLLLVCRPHGELISPDELGIAAATPVLHVATKCDLRPPAAPMPATSAATGAGIEALRHLLADRAKSRGGSPLAPSLSRCRHHVDACLARLRHAHAIVLNEEMPELLALELRVALDELGAMVGAVYTDDLLDRIFSRFCIGK